MYWRSALDAFAADRRGIESWFVVPNADFDTLLGRGGGEPEITVEYRLADEAGRPAAAGVRGRTADLAARPRLLRFAARLSPMLRIALTGGIASGKSFVADEFAALGATIVDSDVLAREVVEPGTPGLERIVERFGEGIVQPDGSLNRAALGRIIFADEQARADLNAIVHPLVREAATRREETAPEGARVIQVIPLLVETGLHAGFDRIIVVDVPIETQLERLGERNGLSEEDALARIHAQAPRDERIAVASHVIDNSGTREETRSRVGEVWEEISRD